MSEELVPITRAYISKLIKISSELNENLSTLDPRGYKKLRELNTRLQNVCDDLWDDEIQFDFSEDPTETFEHMREYHKVRHKMWADRITEALSERRERLNKEETNETSLSD